MYGKTGTVENNEDAQPLLYWNNCRTLEPGRTSESYSEILTSMSPMI